MEQFASHVYDSVARIQLNIPPSSLGGKIVFGAVVSVATTGLLWRFYLRGVFYARFMSKVAPEIAKRLESRNRKLFSGLEELKTKRGDGKLIILDVGSGNGVNFQYYPEGSEVICVDPNRNFEPFLRAGSDTWPTGVHVSQYHAAYCERMHEVIDPEVADAVIASGVLCFLPDLDSCLQEIYRVLKPGGKLFFTEHVLAPPCYPYFRFFQHLLNPLWSFIMGGCNCNRTIIENIRRAGFSQVEAENYEAYELEQPTRLTFFVRVVRSRVSGTATK